MPDFGDQLVADAGGVPFSQSAVFRCPQHLWISVEGIGKALCQDYDFSRDSGEGEGWLKS